ncbi:DUF2829 domain-containing protein [Xenorhabdus bovienii]|uniref:DUF2829 domain-containing protein n=1 Tax=Xenorhabdus bovienii TaxID=40576 RepID=UPI00237D03D8|nr:DUF2829 domain-containing protein [Xenorhabdus bovienii]MDE1476484.1 DUF2829 domain-containing protein [Xenorhabdus bovienii]
MSDVNKLDNKQCPFDPDQYKIDTLAAPVGTSPWALIQVYLGNKVHRKDWSAPDEYIHLVPGNGNDVAPSIQKRDKHGMLTSWQPTQEDLMACDWNLLKPDPKPVECMLSFDLKVGTGLYFGTNQWGYLADDEFKPEEGPFGKLTNLQNKTDITKFSLFIFHDFNQFIYVRASSDNNQYGYQKMVELFKKDLTVTADGVPYHLGSSKDLSDFNGKQPYEFAGGFQTDGAKQLGDLLKQNVGKTLHFCFNWK